MFRHPITHYWSNFCWLSWRLSSSASDESCLEKEISYLGQLQNAHAQRSSCVSAATLEYANLLFEINQLCFPRSELHISWSNCACASAYAVRLVPSCHQMFITAKMFFFMTISDLQEAICIDSAVRWWQRWQAICLTADHSLIDVYLFLFLIFVVSSLFSILIHSYNFFLLLLLLLLLLLSEIIIIIWWFNFFFRFRFL